MEEQVQNEPTNINTSQVTSEPPIEPDFKDGLPPEKEGMKPAIKLFFLVLLLGAISLITYSVYKYVDLDNFPFGAVSNNEDIKSSDFVLRPFTSEQEFRNYFKETEQNISLVQERADFGATGEFEGGATMNLKISGAPEEPGRVSTTNVQVAQIDEADIVKTNGKDIYISNNEPIFMIMEEPLENFGVTSSVSKSMIYPPPDITQETDIVSAFPPETLSKIGSIEKQGEMYLSGNTLVVISNNTLFGYDVTDKENPKEKWQFSLDERQQLITTRLYNDEIYVVSRAFANSSTPCPIPLTGSININCTKIYRPDIQVPSDSTFTITKLSVSNGNSLDDFSFVGSSGITVIYMSPDAIYTTFTYYTDILEFFFDFFNEEGKDLISDELLNKLDELVKLDLSSQAKMAEFSVILQEYMMNLDSDEVLRIENELQNRLNDYSAKRVRELEQSGIVAVDTKNLDLLASGNVPGRALNQFSLDSYEGKLRIATTVGQGNFQGTDSVNDVYVLDEKLDIIGEVLGLGEGETIYSVRFIEDKGYVVTFKQIDPFYILDLSNPNDPKLAGELKIPGYSSYLHPIDKDTILGVGKEESKVKLSLFDVSDPNNPKEKSKYVLDEYWSDVLDTHHAFLLDDKFEVFFIPGSKGGYIFSYKNDELTLEKSVSGITARRALFIDDYMYIIGDTKIVVLDEHNWERVNELIL